MIPVTFHETFYVFYTTNTAQHFDFADLALSTYHFYHVVIFNVNIFIARKEQYSK